MSQQRYHIHICLVKNEQPDLENALQTLMANNYFLTWDLNGTPNNFMDYSRRQIDRCDYVLFILGESYGHLSLSGVSYLHLSYVYATTKGKTLFALIKQADTTIQVTERLTKQRLDFVNLVQNDQADYTTFYSHELTASVKECLFNLAQLIENVPKAGWVKSAKPYLDPQARLFKSSPVARLPATRHSEDFSKDTSDVKGISNTRATKDSATKARVTRTSWLTTDLPQATALSEILPDKIPTNPATITVDTNNPIALEDTILIHYTAHAYKDGNLTELKLQYELMWLDIVVSLRKVKEPFSHDMIQRNLNSLLGRFALLSAKKIQPNTHAVARTQINTADFNHIKQQLIAQRWLTPINSLIGLSRDLWRLSDDLR